MMAKKYGQTSFAHVGSLCAPRCAQGNTLWPDISMGAFRHYPHRFCIERQSFKCTREVRTES
jgi:hypothetical protein